MANQTKDTRPRSEPQTKNPTEWPENPPLPPREIDPSGEGDALRTKAHPGDDTVFAANADEDAENDKKPRADETEPARKKEPRTPNDAERSRTNR
ncbi:MAG: hypothetical protein M3Y87_19015 [Myxococcota bacterium]|nr:hypothetical protein [Myxococcota bacterium]